MKRRYAIMPGVDTDVPRNNVRCPECGTTTARGLWSLAHVDVAQEMQCSCGAWLTIRAEPFPAPGDVLGTARPRRGRASP